VCNCGIGTNAECPCCLTFHCPQCFDCCADDVLKTSNNGGAREAVELQAFQTENELRDHLVTMNYDHGIDPNLAIIDARGSVGLACGTDDGDEMGFAYYRPGPEGRMELDCCGGPQDEWFPKFPVTALGVKIERSQT